LGEAVPRVPAQLAPGRGRNRRRRGRPARPQSEGSWLCSLLPTRAAASMTSRRWRYPDGKRDLALRIGMSVADAEDGTTGFLCAPGSGPAPSARLAQIASTPALSGPLLPFRQGFTSRKNILCVRNLTAPQL